MKMTFKELISICLSMVLAFSLALPVYAGSAISGSISSNYEFDEATGHLTIGKVIEYIEIKEIVDIPLYDIKSVTIRDDVISIIGCAFEGCKGLTSINVDKGNPYLKSIDGVLFSKDGTELIKCPEGKKANNYTIPDSVTKIRKYAFIGCKGLTSINVDEKNPNYKSIGGVIFSKDEKTLHTYPAGKKATNYIIPNSVTKIDYYAFYGCTGLTSITIPDSVTSIGSSAFIGCKGLTSINIGNGVEKIGEGAFKDFTGLTSVTIGNGVKSIGSSAFEGCKGLTSINIPDSVKSIGSSAFEGCKGLISITIDSATIWNRAFADCTGLEKVILGNHVERIARRKSCRPRQYSGKMAVIYYKSFAHENAFYGCTSLKEVTIPKEFDITDIFNENVKVNRI